MTTDDVTQMTQPTHHVGVRLGGSPTKKIRSAAPD